jgi:hypothetical protein
VRRSINACALVAALLTLAVLEACSEGPRPAGTPSATAAVVLSSSPSSPPAADYGPPPKGIPLLYVADPRNYQWLQALDWNGKFVGTVKLLAPLQVSGGYLLSPASSSPDGSQILIDREVLDGDGRVLAELGELAGKRRSSWGGDNRHLCGMRYFDTISAPNGPFGEILFSVLPGSAARDVVRFPLPHIGQGGLSAAACSFKSNRALVYATAVRWPTDWWLVQLTDGAIIRHKTFASEYLRNVVGSDDAAYLAENSPQVTQDPGRSAPYTVIRSTADGAEVGRLTEYGVDLGGFSGDGSLVVVHGKRDLNQTGPARIIEWRTGTVLWTGPDGRQLNGIRALPGGRDFALALSAPPQVIPPGCGPTFPCRQIVDPLRDIVIVHRDGSTTNVPGRYLPVW